MAPRLELHAILLNLLETDQVYFQPPPNVYMKYPAIVYKRDYELANFADNDVYLRRKRYLVTVIDKNPDSDIPDKIAELPLCVYDRFYAADDLNHDVFKLFF
jgi:hypothetical protein